MADRDKLPGEQAVGVENKGQTSHKEVIGLIDNTIHGITYMFDNVAMALSATKERVPPSDDLVEELPGTEIEEIDQLMSFETVKLMKQKVPELMEKVELSPALWASLLNHGVISESEKHQITRLQLSNRGQIEMLWDLIQTVRQHKEFILALIEAGQRRVAINIIHALKQLIHDEPFARVKKSLLKDVSVITGCGPELSMDEMYTPLDIIRKTQTMNQNARVTEDSFFEDSTGKPVKALCVGLPGSGKTTLAKRLAWLWASDKMSSNFWSKIKAVIFVSRRCKGDTLEDILRNSIPGSEHDKDVILAMWKKDPECLLVIVDAFDEFRPSSRIMEEILAMICDEVTNVFLTIRKNHPKMTTSFTAHFNQVYELNGFNPSQGLVFIEKLLRELDCSYDAKGINLRTPSTKTNPLDIVLACVIYADALIQKFTEKEIIALQKATVQRELEKSNDADYHVPEEIKKMQNLAIYCLLRGEAKCTTADLKTFHIDSNSPAMILLERSVNFTTRHGHQTYWTWPSLFDFHFNAATALSKMPRFGNSLWLYWIANRPELNSVAKLLSALLGSEGNYNDVKTLTTATIILQSNAKCSTSVQATKNEHPCQWINFVKDMIEKTMTVKKSFYGGVYFPQEKDIQIPSLGPLVQCRGSLYTDNSSLFQHVQECWKYGLLDNIGDDFIKSCNDILLPACDRSHAEELHVMVNKVGQFPKSNKDKNLAKIGIYLGCGLSKSLVNPQLAEQWTQYIGQIIEDFEPFMIHVYHNGNDEDLTDDVVSALSSRQYEIQTEPNEWKIHASTQDKWFSGRFNHEEAGVLQKMGSSVILRVPVGAVPEGETYNIIGRIHTRLTDFNDCMRNNDEYIAGPVPQLSVEGGGGFDKHVELLIPHCISRGKTHTARVLCGSGGDFKEISTAPAMMHYIDQDYVHIFTKHFTTFVVAGTDVVREISDALLTVAALCEQTSKKSILQLRLMLHSFCAGMNDFRTNRNVFYDPGMQEIRQLQISLPDTDAPANFPMIHISLKVDNGSGWKIRRVTPDQDVLLMQETYTLRGRDVLKVPDKGSKHRSEMLQNCILEGSVPSDELHATLCFEFKYSEQLEMCGSLPLVYAMTQMISDPVSEQIMDVDMTIPDVIDKTAPELLETISLTQNLLRILVRDKVILHQTMQNLKSKSPDEAIDDLLSHIRGGSRQMYHNFRQALLDSNNGKAASLIPENVA